MLSLTFLTGDSETGRNPRQILLAKPLQAISYFEKRT